MMAGHTDDLTNFLLVSPYNECYCHSNYNDTSSNNQTNANITQYCDNVSDFLCIGLRRLANYWIGVWVSRKKRNLY